ncbi:MAG: hypothetical protein SCALA702_07520 [Melioribacteraceae bacterium]|nr:MAG: hypothetical protein SCALA702_07520 [Melioribacteraceae bacterium]
MSEMLGNQYFMARKYELAEPVLESCLRKYPDNKSIKKKLIVCYTQTGKIEQALPTFLSLIKDDIEFIINTDPIDDDCPCPELIYDLENSDNSKDELMFEYEKLGILWLYCDVNKSFFYFKKAVSLMPDKTVLKSIHVILKNYIDGTSPKKNISKSISATQYNGHYF